MIYFGVKVYMHIMTMGLKRCMTTTMTSLIFQIFNGIAEFPNFQWVASFLANEMTRVVDYGYIFEIILKKASKRLDE